MASRTIEQDRDRKMTIMTTGFIPCGAKMPIIGLFAGAVFGESPWVATSAFFIGIAAVVISGIMLKKFKAFAGEPAPFVMELPAYHAPSAGNAVAWIFYPLGWTGDMAWKATVASFTGLIAKENVVNTFAVLYHYAGELSENGDEIWALVGADFGALTAYSFMIFNLLCAPCFAAMGAIKREMNNGKWTAFAIGYMCAFAYVISLIVYQIGGLIAGTVSFNLWTAAALAALAAMICLLARKGYQGGERSRDLSSIAAAAQ